MKYNLKKVATVFASALMLGSTAGLALAANYPAPFVQSGAANAAVVVGSATGADDGAAALSVATDLSSALAGSSGSAVVVEGGDSFKLEKSSDKFYFGDALNSAYSTLDSDKLETFLADGNYKDGDIDTDYEQTITLSSKTLSLFSDKDYKNEEPSVGFWFTNGQNILSYTIAFDERLNTTLMEKTDLPLLNNKYYVLSATTSKVTLLDSADSTVLSDGEEVTVNGKTVSIEYISDTKVKFNVDGEVTDTMSEGDSEELSDGSYIVLTDILYNQKESGVSKAEFSIGSGKIILNNGADVRIGKDDVDSEVDGLVATITSTSNKIDAISLAWNSDDDTFVTEGNPAVMPGFKAITLSYDGLAYADKSEKITFDNGETLTLNMGNYDIPLMWYNSSGAYVQGEENYLLSIANPSAYTYAQAGYANGSTMFWEAGAKVNTSNISSAALALDEDNTFIVTRIDSDLADVETLYYQVKSIDVDDDEVSVTLKDLAGSKDLTFDSIDDTQDHGDVTVTLGAVDAANNTVYLEFSASSGSLTYNKAVSEKGLVVTIPAVSLISGGTITFTEADKDDDLNEGKVFYVTVANSTNDKLYVSLPAQSNVSKEETNTNDIYTAIVNSDLATKIATDESDDEYTIDIEYYGKETLASVSVSGGGKVVESDDPASLGVMTIKDTEAAASTKNLIVLGGSCINSFAASLLSVPAGTCGSAFTTASKVGEGQAMIKSYARTGGKVAVLIAGYEKSDTAKAATFAINNDWDSSSVNLKLSTATANTAVIQ